MNEGKCDAVVFFGATGDLVFKQIFPALYALVKDEGLDVPIIRVAKAGWNLDQLKQRAHESLKNAGIDTGSPASEKLFGLSRYVDGDCNDPATLTQLRKALGDAHRPLRYMAVPPSLFGTVAEP